MPVNTYGTKPSHIKMPNKKTIPPTHQENQKQFIQNSQATLVKRMCQKQLRVEKGTELHFDSIVLLMNKSHTAACQLEMLELVQNPFE